MSDVCNSRSEAVAAAIEAIMGLPKGEFPSYLSIWQYREDMKFDSKGHAGKWVWLLSVRRLLGAQAALDQHIIQSGSASSFVASLSEAVAADPDGHRFTVGDR